MTITLHPGSVPLSQLADIYWNGANAVLDRSFDAGIERAAARIAAIAASFNPDTIMLNTAVRPPAESSVARCPQERLRLLAQLFQPAAQIVGEEPAASFPVLTPEALLELVSRHPASLKFLAAGFKKPEREIRALIESLSSSRKLRIAEHQGELWVFPR